MNRTSSNLSISSQGSNTAKKQKSLFQRMIHALSNKLTQGPGILSIRQNDGTRISTARALKRVNSARASTDYKNQDKVFFPKYLRSDQSGADTEDQSVNHGQHDFDLGAVIGEDEADLHQTPFGYST